MRMTYRCHLIDLTHPRSECNWSLQVSTRSLSWLPAIWFCLCASLVTKHNELITVFIAFVTCFAVAFVLNRTTSKPSKTQLFEKDSAQWQSVEEKRRMRIKNEVGAAACLLALAMFACVEDSGDEAADEADVAGDESSVARRDGCIGFAKRLRNHSRFYRANARGERASPCPSGRERGSRGRLAGAKRRRFAHECRRCRHGPCRIR